MPKPVLSDSLFNADDVATAVLGEANLQVTNQDLGVVDRTSIFSNQNNFNFIDTPQFYSFNGFMFCMFAAATSSTPVSSHTILISTSDSDFYPIAKSTFPTVGRDGDTAYYCYLDTSGNFRLDIPHNTGNTNYYVIVNGWYRFA